MTCITIVSVLTRTLWLAVPLNGCVNFVQPAICLNFATAWMPHPPEECSRAMGWRSRWMSEPASSFGDRTQCTWGPSGPTFSVESRRNVRCAESNSLVSSRVSHNLGASVDTLTAPTYRNDFIASLRSMRSSAPSNCKNATVLQSFSGCVYMSQGLKYMSLGIPMTKHVATDQQIVYISSGKKNLLGP